MKLENFLSKNSMSWILWIIIWTIGNLLNLLFSNNITVSFLFGGLIWGFADLVKDVYLIKSDRLN